MGNAPELVVIEKLFSLKVLALRGHYYCNDCWYTCPKHPEGCCNDDVGPDCNCGADRHNKKVEELWDDIIASR